MADANGGVPPDREETPETNVPVTDEVMPDRFSSDEVFQRIVADADHSVVLFGATEQGLLARLVADSLHMNVVDEVDCSVLLSERPTDRPLRERLFGSGRREKGRPSRD